MPFGPPTRVWRLLAILAVQTLALSAMLGTPPDLEPGAVTSNQTVVPRAPMGWVSWNTFFENIDRDVIKAQADAMVSSGLAAAGYTYVNIDSGWWKGTRDGAGNITVDTSKWPGGMQAIADYIHSKGLKAGIYTDAGHDGCSYYYPTPGPAAPGTGSADHYEQDMLQFARWGFDMVKVDWCGGDVEGLDPVATYQAISDAVRNAAEVTGRQMSMSICEWGRNDPWNWAPGLAPMWRSSSDIIFSGETPSMARVTGNFDKSLHPTSQHTGYYNDPDMMMVGMPGLSAAQNRTHMSLWAIGGAPLLLGNDLTALDATTTTIVTNSEVIAVAQDPRGLPAVEVAEDTPNRQVYAKVLAGTGRRAVALLNRTSSAATMTLRWADLGLTTASATVRNLWTSTTVGSFATSYGVPVPAGEAVLLTVTGTEAAASTYEAEASGNTRSGSAAIAPCATCSGVSRIGHVGNGSANTLRFNGVSATASGPAVATIAYVNGDSTTRRATLQVNGSQTPTTVAFPPTGSWRTPGTVSVVVSLAKGGTNTMTFSNTSARAPDLDAIEVRELPGASGTQVVGVQSGRCVDMNNNTTANGMQAQLWDCNGGRNQTWTYTARKELVVYGNKCLDAYDEGTSNGTRVVIWDCNGQSNQQWNVNSNGTVTGVQSGLCLDASAAGSANGTKLILWSCTGQTNQQWTRT